MVQGGTVDTGQPISRHQLLQRGLMEAAPGPLEVLGAPDVVGCGPSGRLAAGPFCD